MFVTAVSGEACGWGIGKLLSQNGADCTVEYFDAPMAEPILWNCQSSDLRTVSLPAQSRVYSFNPGLRAWEIGRLLDDHGDTQLIKFPNDSTRHLDVSEVFVRWDRPIVDPTAFLAAAITETPRFTDGRAPFVRSLLQQRAAALGMSALPSSAIELEAHQVEVVRKVLQDPIQRYLLADEVGLGKTIEAGVLIRQCVLDDRAAAVVLVLVPEALVSQWRLELSAKFFLGDLLDKTVFVEPFSAPDRIRTHLASATMLVIDEAHHLTSDTGSQAVDLFDDLVQAAPDIDRVLLLSATPALHNERGFLRMLHLLDPSGYSLNGEEAFRKRVEERQALAEIAASLTPDNALYLDDTLDQLAAMFPDDVRLQDGAGRLRDLIAAMPPEDDPVLIDAVAVVRDHLSEVYRLHRRVLRHRRRNVIGLTPDRAGAVIFEYASAASVRAAATADEWRFAEMIGRKAATLDETSRRASFALAARHAGYAIQPLSADQPVADRVSAYAQEAFVSAMASAAEPERAKDRIEALVEAIRGHLAPKVQFIVFCSDPQTADEVAAVLAARIDRPVDRHDLADDGWRAFGEDSNRSVLVCDYRAEEGLNLQGGEKIVVHYDLPWAPNRIEQRLGRADRYGSGRSVKSIVLCCRDDPQEIAWARYLNEALRVFDRSIASLQYLIEQTARDLPALLLAEGAEGVLDLLEQDKGEDGRIAREIKSINQQDALDALGVPPCETLDALSDLDDDWRQIEIDVGGWIQTTLMFGRSNEPPGPGTALPGGTFRYRYQTGAQHTLLPLEAFYQRCQPAIDLEVRVVRSRDVWTVPYSYRRPSVLARQGRSVRARLVRYGDPLLTGLRDLAQRDERGRSTSFWRHLPQTDSREVHLFFRFDFVIEADVAAANDILDLAGQLTPSAVSSLSRRGDMALAPSFHTIWLNRELEPVTDQALLATLAAPYRVDTSDQGGRDFNLNPRRWRALKSLGVAELADWSGLCREARLAAEAHLRRLPDLNAGLDAAARRAEALDAGRLGLLQARATRKGDQDLSDARDLDLERALSEQLIAGIRTPRVSLDAVCACFLGSDLSIATALGRG